MGRGGVAALASDRDVDRIACREHGARPDRELADGKPPEAVVGGGLARLHTGDRIQVDLNTRRVDALVPADEWERRAHESLPPSPPSQTPWEQLYRQNVGQLNTGACLECAVGYRCVGAHVARHNH